MLNRTLRGLYLGLEYDETLKLKQPNDRVLLLEKGKRKNTILSGPFKGL